jgi:hypothetical protein
LDETYARASPALHSRDQPTACKRGLKVSGYDFPCPCDGWLPEQSLPFQAARRIQKEFDKHTVQQGFSTPGPQMCSVRPAYYCVTLYDERGFGLPDTRKHACWCQFLQLWMTVQLHEERIIIMNKKKAKAVPLHATKVLGRRGIAPTHSRPRH